VHGSRGGRFRRLEPVLIPAFEAPQIDQGRFVRLHHLFSSARMTFKRKSRGMMSPFAAKANACSRTRAATRFLLPGLRPAPVRLPPFFI